MHIDSSNLAVTDQMPLVLLGLYFKIISIGCPLYYLHIIVWFQWNNMKKINCSNFYDSVRKLMVFVVTIVIITAE